MATRDEDLNEDSSDAASALMGVVQSFDVFVSDTRGTTGNMMRPSKGDLENVFGTHDLNVIVKLIVENGVVRTFQGIEKK